MADRTVTFWYGVVEHGDYRHELTCPGVYDLADELDLDMLSTRAADDYHGNHDGWEASWPLTFALAATEDGPELGRFSVDREAVPMFTARKVATPAASASNVCGDASGTTEGAKHG